jgi:uncharacterized membrane protein
MGVLYMLAGLYHFINPNIYVKMIKNFMPYPMAVVYISGVIEMLLGLGVCFEAIRSISAIGIILLLIAVFPANINMALHPEDWKFSTTLLYLRLPLQALLIYWAWLYI